MGMISRLWNKVLVRYFLSYFIVLFIPIFTFSVLHEKYFVILYRDGIIQQNNLSLSNTCSQIGFYFSEMEALGIQLSANEMLSYSSLRADSPLYNRIQSALKGYRGAKPFFSSIDFYSYGNPNVIFTAEGTYNPRFYKKFNVNGDAVSLTDYLQNMNASQWSFAGGEITRVVPVPARDGCFLILGLDERSIQSLVNDADCLTLVLDSSNTPIYPREIDSKLYSELLDLNETAPYTLISEGRYALSSYDPRSGVRCVRIITDDVILKSVTELQFRYGLALFAILLAGGSVIYIMAFLSYKPIRDLNALAEKSVSGIPTNLNGVEKAGFAIKKMEEEYSALKKVAAKEKLILRLIYGKHFGSGSLKMDCEAAGIDVYAEEYRIALLTVKTAANVEDTVGRVLGDEIHFQLMAYPDDGCYLLLLGYGPDAKLVLYDKLCVIAQELSPDEASAAKIAAGNGYTGLGELSYSYVQAVAANSSPAGVTLKYGVRFFEHLDNAKTDFIYPKLEISALYKAVENADVERVRLMTDILTDMVRSKDIGKFLRTSICFDVIKSFTRAQEELMENAAVSPYPDDADPDTLVIFIESMCRQAVMAMQDGGGGKKDDKSSSQILAYIDGHVRDSELCVGSVANHFSLSLSTLSHRFKAQTGLNISNYISEKKILYAKELLVTTALTLAEIAELIGYRQPSSFMRKFKQIVNMTPSEYREEFARQREGY